MYAKSQSLHPQRYRRTGLQNIPRVHIYIVRSRVTSEVCCEPVMYMLLTKERASLQRLVLQQLPVLTTGTHYDHT